MSSRSTRATRSNLTDSIILTTLTLPDGNASPIQADDNTINVSTFDVAGAAADRGFVIGVFSRRASPRRTPIGRLVACAQVDAAGALVGKRFGVAAAPVLAASVYTYTFGPNAAIDPTQGILFANAVGSTSRYVGGTIASDTTFGVATADQAGAPADIAHRLCLAFRVIEWRTYSVRFGGSARAFPACLGTAGQASAWVPLRSSPGLAPRPLHRPRTRRPWYRPARSRP